MTQEPLPPKPLPRRTAESEPFWEGCAQNELRYQCCAACGHVQFYPRAFCTACQGDRLDWRVSAGRGSVHTYTIVHRAPTAAFRGDVPYIIALVDVEEGFRMMMNVRGCAHEAIHVGMPVRIVFEPMAGEAGKLPQAVPA